MRGYKSWEPRYSPIDKKRLCKHLRQPLVGMSESNLVLLWNEYTDLYLPRVEGKNKPLINIITGKEYVVE